MTHPPTARRTPPLARRRSGRVVAGVAGGIADHLGVEVFRVRLVLALLVPLGGLGIAAYGLLWMFVRQEPVGVRRAVPAEEGRQAYGLLALAIAGGLVASVLGDSGIGLVLGPLGVVAIGAALVWREVDGGIDRPPAPTPRAPEPAFRTLTAVPEALPTAVRVRNAVDGEGEGDGDSSGEGDGGGDGGGEDAPVPGPAPVARRRLRRSVLGGVLRVLAGALFVAAGLGVFLLGRLDLGQVQFGLLAVLATLVGVAVLTVPWWLRLVRDLGEERRARIVTAERAELAAHLHDSVLQTLALIQRQADQPREVLRLARGQERELRTWLYGPGGYHTNGVEAGLTGALAAAAAEVEDTYAVTVAPVVVGGDRPLDDGLRALVLAAREAMVNAAKHAGVPEVSVFAEVERGAVHVFVRDRGRGFDPAAVPADRHGLADSVRARMDRQGGTVGLRAAPGAGTEVHLTIPVDGVAEPVRGPHRGDNDAEPEQVPGASSVERSAR